MVRFTMSAFSLCKYKIIEIRNNLRSGGLARRNAVRNLRRFAFRHLRIACAFRFSAWRGRNGTGGKNLPPVPFYGCSLNIAPTFSCGMRRTRVRVRRGQPHPPGSETGRKIPRPGQGDAVKQNTALRRENARRGAFLRGAAEMPPAFPAISAAGHIAFGGRFWYDTIEISGFVGGIAGWQMCW